MRIRVRRLLQQQAIGRRGRKESPATIFFDQKVVIVAGIESQQRQPKAVLPAELAVATSGVAAGLGENRDDLIGEIDRAGDGSFRDGKRGLGRLAAGRRGGDRHAAVGQGRDDPAVGDLDDAGGIDLILDRAGQIASPAVGIAAIDN